VRVVVDERNSNTRLLLLVLAVTGIGLAISAPSGTQQQALLGSFLRGSGAGELVSQLWPMALIGLVTLAAADWLFRKRVT